MVFILERVTFSIKVIDKVGYCVEQDYQHFNITFILLKLTQNFIMGPFLMKEIFSFI